MFAGCALSGVYLPQSCSGGAVGVFAKQKNISSQSCKVCSTSSRREVFPGPDDGGDQGFKLWLAKVERK